MRMSMRVLPVRLYVSLRDPARASNSKTKGVENQNLCERSPRQM